MNDKSLILIRAARATAVLKGDPVAAQRFAAAQWGPGNDVSDFLKRGIVDTDSVQPNGAVLRDLGAFLLQLTRRRSALGRVAAVVPFLNVPFSAPILEMTTEAQAGWTPETQKITASGQAFKTFEMDILKVAGMCVYSMEFLRASDVNLDAAIRRDLSRALAKVEDATFFNPANDGVVGASPASPFAGRTVAGDGNVADAIASLFEDADEDVIAESVLCVNPLDVGALIAAGYGRDGALTVEGGYCAGLPTVTAPVPRGSVGYVCPPLIAMSDGGANVEAATQSTVEVVDADTGEVTIRSLWAENLTALRVLHFTNWRVGRDDAAKLVTGAID
ncbi:phage major capsid protein [Paraburkholderia sp. BR10872]|uniref:phage major capsid protein n=1 Tax=Paraburkholderia sp. BR10872 TaxID=3236989 RepID=UPI0034D343FA